jgi:lipopolysaccharide/colanic/teichoic acid biosynthesis glycosyltransferase
MHVDADQKLKGRSWNPAARVEWEKTYKLKNDLRITRIGHFLRKNSFDELLQSIHSSDVI